MGITVFTDIISSECGLTAKPQSTVPGLCRFNRPPLAIIDIDEGTFRKLMSTMWAMPNLYTAAVTGFKRNDRII